MMTIEISKSDLEDIATLSFTLCSDGRMLRQRLNERDDVVNTDLPVGVFRDSVRTRIEQLNEKGIDFPRWEEWLDKADGELRSEKMEDAVNNLLHEFANQGFLIDKEKLNREVL